MRTCASILVPLVLLAGCEGSPDAVPDLGPPPEGPAVRALPATAINPRLLRRFAALRPTEVGPAAQVALGRMLFHDPRLSRDGDLSCNSCHPLDRYGVDHEVTSIGRGGRRVSRNAPSVYNTGGHVAQFWDGRASTLEDQAGGPLLNPNEMAQPDRAAVVAALRAIPGYGPAFRAAYPGQAAPVSFDNATAAIAAFERGLLTPSRWDRYLDGEAAALRADELEGFRLFSDIGCVECHTGEQLGASSFQKAGRVWPWPDGDDPGRFAVTAAASDEMVFKVPSLRNVARTAPYFHDGSAATLEEAVKMMAHHQLDLTLSPAEVKLVVAWLDSLTGELPADYIRTPSLP